MQARVERLPRQIGHPSLSRTRPPPPVARERTRETPAVEGTPTPLVETIVLVSGHARQGLVAHALWAQAGVRDLGATGDAAIRA